FKSIAITADSINNLSDAFSCVITLVGFKLSSRPADEKHPYGHARYEYISGLAVSFIILLIGVELVKSSFEKIIDPEPTLFSFLSVIVLLVSIGIKLWQSNFNKFVGRKIKSTALEATSADSLNDVIATSAVLISTIVAKLFGWQIDGYMGLGVALFIIYSAIKLIGETLNPLIGVAPDDDFVCEIEERILSYKGILGIHDLVIHNYGPGRCFASVHAEVSANEDILVSHDIIDNIERDFMTKMDIHLVIHLDPIVTDNEYINNLRKLTKEIIDGIDSLLSMHDFRIVVGTTHTNLIFETGDF
ncbi:MAG: cation-efflux pump, partial [Oscillospiraceae bacterium]|nr:cation-efflux pump [Oscillospiraceae bacterium]